MRARAVSAPAQAGQKGAMGEGGAAGAGNSTMPQGPTDVASGRPLRPEHCPPNRRRPGCRRGMRNMVRLTRDGPVGLTSARESLSTPRARSKRRSGRSPPPARSMACGMGSIAAKPLQPGLDISRVFRQAATLEQVLLEAEPDLAVVDAREPVVSSSS